MNSSIKAAVTVFSLAVTSIPFMAASAQQPGVTPLSGNETILYSPATHTRNIAIGSTEASRAAEAAAAQAKGKKSQADIARGETLMKAGDLDGAVDAFQQVLTYDPSYGLAYQRLAEAQTAAGELNDAATSYRAVLYPQPGKNWGDVQNGDPAIHMQFALLLLRLNQRAEALSVYQHGYQLLQSETAGSTYTAANTVLPPMLAAPNFTAPQMEAAADTMIGIHKYNWDGQSLAAADFQRALKLQPDSAVAHFYLGQIYRFQTGHAADAVREFRKAAELGGPKMQPFLQKAKKDGNAEFTQALQKAGEAGR